MTAWSVTCLLRSKRERMLRASSKKCHLLAIHELLVRSAVLYNSMSRELCWDEAMMASRLRLLPRHLILSGSHTVTVQTSSVLLQLAPRLRQHDTLDDESLSTPWTPSVAKSLVGMTHTMIRLLNSLTLPLYAARVRDV
jgi:hypothetical protein